MTRLDTIIRGARVVLRDSVEELDIGITGEKISALSSQLVGDEDTEIIEANGLTVMPGAVDIHVHFNEPGLESWEGFRSGSASLAAGGITTYVDMPLNGVPPTIRPEAWESKMKAANGQSYVDYAFWGGLVPGNQGELAPLAELGAAGFKAFMSEPGGEGDDIFARADDDTLLNGMYEIAKLNRVLALHAEDETMVAELGARSIADGRIGPMDYVQSRPAEAEVKAVSRALQHGEQTGCALHFVHISTWEALDLIAEAKQRGLDVTSETCPHYLTLTDEEVVRLGAVAKCAPPLRSQAEQDRLWDALAAGLIDVIASDHSPCPPSMKQSDNFFEIWGGISGAQSTLLLMLEEGHLQRSVALPLLGKVLALQPARRLGLESKGEIAIGKDADLVLIDWEKSTTLNTDDLHYTHKQSPYVGRTFSCSIADVFCRGTRVYSSKTGLSDEPVGRFIRAYSSVPVGVEGTEGMS
ncbi:allantoinase AllB [Paenibacillus taichungensis]|uniref:Allantoinase n=1 Tax=Paenibacillus taichungensis TaxID=484184 RepID=A0A329QK44_9BACL|nr:allantoinase AllB [Paenibacillus taichungensis]RAW12694.1 allantoinase AllB [Paenibacillus taichungensis]